MTLSYEAASLLSSGYVNFLPVEDFVFGADTGTWTASNASLSVENTTVFRNSYKPLSVTALLAGSPETLFSITHTPRVVGTSFINDSVDASAHIFCTVPINVSITVSSSLPESVAGAFVEIPASTWTAITSPSLAVPTNITNLNYSATISFKSISGPVTVLVAHPVLRNSYGFARNNFVREAITYLPRFFLETDSEQSNPDFPMTRFMDVGLAYAGRAFDQSINFRYRDVSSGFSENDNATKSFLVNPDTVLPEYMPWLAQFIGIKLDRIVSGTTPWGNLPATWEEIHEEIDPDPDVTYSISSVTRDGLGLVTAILASSPTQFSVGDTISVEGASSFNGQFVLTSVDLGLNTVGWTQDGVFETLSTGTLTLVDSDWIEIESYNVADSNFIPARRDLIRERRTGHDSGTCLALERSIKVFLNGTKSVDVFTDPIQFPWQIFVRTLTAETPGGVTGVESSSLLSELNKSRPMGFVVHHECVTSL